MPRKKRRITPQSTPRSPIAMGQALGDVIEVLEYVLRSERVDISGPESDIAWKRLQLSLGMCRVALNPEQEEINGDV